MEKIKSGFKWVEISPKIANKMLEYKNKDNELMKIIQEVKEETGKKTESKNGITINKIDGFSAMNIIFIRTQNIKKKDIFIERLQEKLNLKAENPNEEYRGIPNLNYTKLRLTNGLEDESELRKALWNLFEKALKYADDNNNENKKGFIESYNNVIESKIKLTNKIDKHFLKQLTVSLFLCRPTMYIPLDICTIQEIKNIKIYEDNVEEYCKKGENYLDLLNSCKEYIKGKNSLQYKNIYELSDYAYNKYQVKDDINYYSAGCYIKGIENLKSIFLEKEIYAIGWKELGNFKKYNSKENLIQTINKIYPGKKDCKDSVKNFINLQENDIIILRNQLVKGHGATIHAVGRVLKSFSFDDDDNDNGYIFNQDLGHTIPVKWIKKYEDGLVEYDVFLNNTLVKLEGKDKEKILDIIEDSLDDIKIEETAYLPKDLIGKNVIFYGAPGCGKSYQVSKVEKKYFKKECTDRILFYPEYTYSDFVGQIVPTINKENDKKTLSYAFKAGPFTKILYKALTNPKEEYCLIIEEINRGNAAAIFGDIFQLLDRIDKNKEEKEEYSIGDSEYPIKNDLIFEYLLEQMGKEKTKEILKGTEKIYIPHNLTILATMNSNDQNVFVLDTAFKRRWKFRYIKNNFDDKSSQDFFKTLIPTNGKSITWKEFICKINEKIPDLNNGINGDDKLIGPYFVSEEDLKDVEIFAHKIFLYLWNDVAKTNKKALFKEDKSLEKLIDAYCDNGIKVFADGIFDEIDSDDNYIKEDEKDE